MWMYVLAWMPMVLIAIANGALRELWYGKFIGELQAHQVSTVSGILLLGGYIWIILRIWQPESSGQAFTVGLIWLGLTVAFEFVFGHYISGLQWTRLLHNYNLFAGRVWVFVLVWVMVAPSLFYRLQK